MVLNFYRLREQPFGVTPDPRFLYLSPTHREALASLLYGITTGRGFMALIAQPGMGKTTLLFQLLQRLEKAARTVFLFQTQCNSREFLRSLLADLGIEDCEGDLVRMHSRLNEVLVQETKARKRFVVVIDEAQNLEDSVLEVVRMLSNFETPSEKLMQIVLAGQPQLAERLASPNLIQLRQRVSILGRLQPFTPKETDRYIDHRLRIAGYDFRNPLFTARARTMIAGYSEGIPRNINNLCFNVLSLGCALQRATIDHDLLREVLNDLDLSTLKPERASDPAPSRPVSDILSLPGRGQKKRSAIWNWLPRLGIGAVLLLAMIWPLVRSIPRHLTAEPGKGSLASENTRAMDDPKTPPSPPRAVAPHKPIGARVRGSAGERETEPAKDESPSSKAVLGGMTEGLLGSDEVRSLVIEPNETLYRICLHQMGKYDREALDAIRALNPWLNDPNRIQSGQRIRIPSMDDSSRGLPRTTKLGLKMRARRAENP